MFEVSKNVDVISEEEASFYQDSAHTLYPNFKHYMGNRHKNFKVDIKSCTKKCI
jgi:hypothetical protein